MIVGSISGRRAAVRLLICGPLGDPAEVEFVVDTGFTATFTLPTHACEALQLPFSRIQPADLADSSRTIVEVYEATVL